VAGTVGEMMLPIMGTAPGYTIEDARPPAIALGIALQLTNILRDVGEDRMRKRIYLPQEDLRRYGVTEADLFKGKLSKNYVEMTKFEIERARDWYDKSADGIKMLAPDAQLPIRAAADMYASILNKIEVNDYDNFDKRAYTTKLEKLMLLPGSFAKVKANGNGNGP
jgi:phytoene synthase